MKRTSRLTTAVAVALAAAGLHAGSFTSDFSNPAQTGLTLIGGARANGDPYPAIANGVLAITYAEGSLNGTVILDDLDAGQAISGFTMNFKVRIGGGTSDPADGISIYFGSDLQGTAFGEEGPDGGQGLVVCFDTFNNGDNEAPAIDVKYAGNLIARVPYTAGNLQSDTFSNVSITLKSNGTLDLVYKGQTVHSNLLIPGLHLRPRPVRLWGPHRRRVVQPLDRRPQRLHDRRRRGRRTHGRHRPRLGHGQRGRQCHLHRLARRHPAVPNPMAPQRPAHRGRHQPELYDHGRRRRAEWLQVLRPVQQCPG